jgi:hypothetical protein
MRPSEPEARPRSARSPAGNSVTSPFGPMRSTTPSKRGPPPAGSSPTCRTALIQTFPSLLTNRSLGETLPGSGVSSITAAPALAQPTLVPQRRRIARRRRMPRPLRICLLLKPSIYIHNRLSSRSCGILKMPPAGLEPAPRGLKGRRSAGCKGFLEPVTKP